MLLSLLFLTFTDFEIFVKEEYKVVMKINIVFVMTLILLFFIVFIMFNYRCT